LTNLNLQTVHEYYHGYPAKRMKTLEQDDTDYHRDVEIFNQLYKDIRNLRITNNTNTNNNFSSNVSTIDDDIVLTDYSIEVDNNLLDEVFKEEREESVYVLDKEVTRDQINKKLIENAIQSEKTFIKIDKGKKLIPNEMFVKI
jgi:hypothetical protein